jgi:hypothetical protein
MRTWIFRITAPHFVAGGEGELEINLLSPRVTRTAPIIDYMRKQGWCFHHVIDYCKRKGWKYEEWEAK